MNNLIENFESIVLIALIVIIVFILILLFSHYNIKSFLLNRKYKISSLVIIDPNTKEESIRIRVFNQNINDVRITSLGLVYQKQNLDYYQKYLRDNNYSLEHKVSISSREYIELELDIKLLKDLIYNLNNETNKVDKIEVYVIDNLGVMNKIKSNDIKAVLRRKNKEENNYKKRVLKEQIKKQKIEKKIEKMIISKEKGSNRFEKFKLKVKSIFKRKKC